MQCWYGQPGETRPAGPLHDLQVVQLLALRPADLEVTADLTLASLPVLQGLPRVLLELPDEVADLLQLGHSLSPRQHALLREAMRLYLRPENFHWVLTGQVLDSARHSRRQLAQLACLRIYEAAPARLPGSRRDVADAVRHLLQDSGGVAVPDGDSGMLRVLRRALVKPGILRAAGPSKEPFLVFSSEPEPRCREGMLFSGLVDLLYGRPRPEGCSFQELQAWFWENPRRLRGGQAQLFLAAALRSQLQHLQLNGPDGPGPLTPDRFLRAWREPRRWTLHYRVGGAHEEAFLRSIRQLFRSRSFSHSNAGLDPWEQARTDLAEWFRELPTWTRKNADGHSNYGRSLLKVASLASSEPGPTLFRDILAGEFRCKGIPGLGEQVYLLDRVNQGRLELEGHLNGQWDRLAVKLYGALVGRATDPATAREFLTRGGRAWLAGFPAEVRQHTGYSPWAEGLRAALLGDGEWATRWFVELPQQMDLPALSEWEDDHSAVFLTRTTRARVELELWRVQELDQWGGTREEKMGRLGLWLRRNLQAGELLLESAEKFLHALREELSQ